MPLTGKRETLTLAGFSFEPTPIHEDAVLASCPLDYGATTGTWKL